MAVRHEVKGFLNRGLSDGSLIISTILFRAVNLGLDLTVDKK
jgi:hypothetical protein